MSDKVVWLEFKNPNAPLSTVQDLIYCACCRNKTFKIRCDLGIWPELYCAACNAAIGAFGWAKQAQETE